MSSKLMEAGYGSVLAFVSGQSSVMPMINSIHSAENASDAMASSVNVLQTSASLWEMVGKELPVLKVAGMEIPITTLGLSGVGLVFDIKSMHKSYDDTGKIEIKYIYSALGNITSAASALALMGAIAAGTAAAPALLATATVLTLAGAVLSIASVSAKGTVDVNEILNNVHDSLQPISDVFGDAYHDVVQSLAETLDEAGKDIDIFQSVLQHLGADIADGANNLAHSLHEALDKAFAVPADLLAAMFDQAANMISPLVIDLDDDGVETADKPVYFDHDGNGFAQLSGWAGKDDGLLVLDRNGNHQIDDGSELFGDNTVTASGKHASNGFSALAEYDSNGDGKIDAQDKIFSQLQVWQDRNGNGVADDGELLSMAQAGINAINLSWKSSDKADGYGNQFRQLGNVVKSDGSTAEMADVWFKQTYHHSEDKHQLKVSDDIARLPNIIASGNVSDLQQAMMKSQDGALKSLVEQFSEQEDAQVRHQLVDTLLRQWSGASEHATDSRGEYVDAQKLYTLEAFLGSNFRQDDEDNPRWNAAEKIESTYQYLLDTVYSQLMLQTHSADLMQQINWQVKEGHVFSDTSAMISALRENFNQDHQLALKNMSELVQALHQLDGGFSKTILSSLSAQTKTISDEFSQVLAFTLSKPTMPMLFGTAVDEELSADRNTATAMFGFDGNDKLFGSNSIDILYGGKGDDYLAGGGRQ